MSAGPDNYPLKMFDLVTLRLFLTVVDTGSIRAASEALNISPSAVSRRLTELERDFGQSFFKRHSRGVDILDAGQLMAAKARSVFAAIDDIRIELRRVETGEAGLVLLNANGTAFVSGLAEDLNLFAAAHPRIGVELREQLSPEVVESISSGKAELGFISRTFRVPPEIKSFTYGHDSLVLAVPSGHNLASKDGVTLSDIAAYRTIGVLEGSSMTRLIRRVSVLRMGKFNYHYMAGTNEVARTLVAHGHGVAILPAAFVRPYEGMLPITSVPIQEDWAKREISIIQHREKPLSASARIMRDFLLARAEERNAATAA